NLEASRPPASAGTKRLRSVLVENRLLCLCEQHAVLFRASGKTTLAELRALFQEPSGHRSLLPRRAPLDRRIFPRPEGRRTSDGRRHGDRDA
ncbi:MAG TPA: hypothetical protein VK524_12350, partial [Polyangiaceae bacterium]|nr:hypothetical protein [Polyangiaceae bacterium]